jgi:serine/threonine protein phosphatase PrpC
MSQCQFSNLMQELDKLTECPSSSVDRFRVATYTDIGGRDSNQDALGVWENERWLCAVVADGAGGHVGGELAANTVVSDLLRRFSSQPALESAYIADLVKQTNAQLLRLQKVTPSCADMHATVVAVFIDKIDRMATWCHSGDSRLYFYCNGVLLERTHDHSLMQLWRDRGLSDELPVHQSALYTALGEPESSLQVQVTAQPRRIPESSSFLLLTDGFWTGFVDTDWALDTVPEGFNLQQHLDALGAQILKGSTGSIDNLSAVAVLCPS